MEEKHSLAGVSEGIYKKWFVLAWKSVSITRNEALLKNKFSLYRKTPSSGNKIEENSFHWQENVFRLKLVLSNFNNDSQQYKKIKNIKTYCFH